LAVTANFPYIYDLAEEWFNKTNLPFVFAAWVSNKNLGDTFKEEFSAALLYGINNIDSAIRTYDFSVLSHHISPKTYLEKYIDYKLDENKIKGMNLFLEYANEFQ